MEIEVEIIDIKHEKRTWEREIHLTKTKTTTELRVIETYIVQYNAPEIAEEGLNSYMLEDTIRKLAEIPDNAWCKNFEEIREIDGTIIKNIHFMICKNHSHKRKRTYFPSCKVKWYEKPITTI